MAINFVGVGVRYTDQALLGSVTNSLRTQTFGVVETIGGLLKIILVFGSAILMYVIAGHGKHCRTVSNLGTDD